MRSLPLAAAAALLAFPLAVAPFAQFAFAQTTPAAPAPVAPAPVAPAPMTAPTAPGDAAAPATPPKTAHRRQTLQQHFDAANTTHDGHLTKEQATAAKWSYVVKHFSAIDKDHKGFVTVDDIHAYARAAHAARHVTPKPATPAAATTN